MYSTMPLKHEYSTRSQLSWDEIQGASVKERSGG